MNTNDELEKAAKRCARDILCGYNTSDCILRELQRVRDEERAAANQKCPLCGDAGYLKHHPQCPNRTHSEPTPELDAIILDAWQELKEKILCGESFAQRIKPYFLRAIVAELEAAQNAKEVTQTENRRPIREAVHVTTGACASEQNTQEISADESAKRIAEAEELKARYTLSEDCAIGGINKLGKAVWLKVGVQSFKIEGYQDDEEHAEWFRLMLGKALSAVIEAECAPLLSRVTALEAELKAEKIWKIEDPRMLREQCRVGDVAFQHLFCTSKGMELPDWVTDGLPKMYHTLEHIKSLEAKLAEARLALEKSNAAMWDGHYGKGIKVAYAQNVPPSILTELSTLRRQVEEAKNLLRPFALCADIASRFRAIPPEKTWLWKPSSNTEELPGISVAHCDAAKLLLNQLATGKEKE